MRSYFNVGNALAYTTYILYTIWVFRGPVLVLNTKKKTFSCDYFSDISVKINRRIFPCIFKSNSKWCRNLQFFQDFWANMIQFWRPLDQSSLKYTAIWFGFLFSLLLRYLLYSICRNHITTLLQKIFTLSSKGFNLCERNVYREKNSMIYSSK